MSEMNTHAKELFNLEAIAALPNTTITIGDTEITPASPLHKVFTSVITSLVSDEHVTVTAEPRLQPPSVAARKFSTVTRPDIMQALRKGKLTTHRSATGQLRVDIEEVEAMHNERMRKKGEEGLKALHSLWDFEREHGLTDLLD
jgi:hypothetical protein